MIRSGCLLATIYVSGCLQIASASAQAAEVVVQSVSVSVSAGRAKQTRRRRTRLDPAEIRRRHASVAPYIEEAARTFNLPPALIRAVIRVESNFCADAKSDVGALGLMQLMPATAAAMGVQDPFDERANILGGTRYLRLMLERWGGNLVLAAASYNAGPAAVVRYKGVPPFAETRAYVRRVVRHYRAYASGRILLRR